MTSDRLNSRPDLGRTWGQQQPACILKLNDDGGHDAAVGQGSRPNPAPGCRIDRLDVGQGRSARLPSIACRERGANGRAFPLSIKGPAMIAVNGYARVSANRKKHDDLSQIGSVFYAASMRVFCLRQKPLQATPLFPSHQIQSSSLNGPNFDDSCVFKYPSLFCFKGMRYYNPTRTTFLVVGGWLVPDLRNGGTLPRAIYSMSHYHGQRASYLTAPFEGSPEEPLALLKYQCHINHRKRTGEPRAGLKGIDGLFLSYVGSDAIF